MGNLSNIKKIVSSAQNIVITCHINPDGDAIGSMLAMGLGLKQLNKNVIMVCRDGIPSLFKILPGASLVLKHLDDKIKYDLIIAVDCNSPDILGIEEESLKKTDNVLEIDHHEFREFFGTLALVDNKAAANGEIIFYFLKYLGVTVNVEIAQNLLTAIIVETNSFRLPTVKAETFKICAQLMSTGVDFAKLTDIVYWAQKKEAVLLTGICLSRCHFLRNDEIVWSFIKQKDFDDQNGLDEDVDAVPDIMRSIQNVKVAVLFREKDGGNLRVSLRSKGAVNVAKIAREYKGGGHNDMAGCFLPNNNKAIDEFILRVTQELESQISNK